MAWIFFLYLGVLLLIGFATRRATKGMSGYLLADRRVGPWTTALSYEATAYSGWLMLGFPGRAFSRGVAAIWVGVACVFGDALNWVGVARRLREQTARLGALTIPEYLERRFAHAGGNAVRATASLAILIFMSIYLWAQCVAGGKLLATVLAMDYPLAASISALVIIIYTFQGGYRALVWTDCVQAMMAVVALIVLPAACLYQVGGWSGLAVVLDHASADASAASSTGWAGSHLGEWFAGLSGLALFTFLFEDAGVGIGYLGQPHICARFMAIRDARYLRAACVASIVWAALVCTGAVGVGLVAHGWFRLAPASASAPDGGAIAPGDPRPCLNDPEEALPRLAIAVFPQWLAGFVVSAIMAPIMSSSASFLLSASSSLSEDVYPHLLRRTAGEKELLLVARSGTLAIGLIALGLAVTTDPDDKQSAVYSLVLYAWGGLSGCFSAPILLALYYQGMTRAGCVAGMIVGAVTILVWHNVPALAGVAYEVIPAIVLSALSIVVVSQVTRPKSGSLEVVPAVSGEGPEQ
jgi:sodium/proline symporter